MSKVSNCNICPRKCMVDKGTAKLGFCGASNKVKIARAATHMWEEPFLSGGVGSGTVFFSNCNLRCVYCQNRQISHFGIGVEMTTEQLVDIFLKLSEECDNINLVTPTHYSEEIRDALLIAKREGLSVPVVYNTSAYESVYNIKSFEGLIDIYLPDIKYFDDVNAIKYSSAPGYFNYAKDSIKEMLRQVGHLEMNEKGLAVSGLAIRHLVLPGHIDDSFKILDWIRNDIGKYTFLSLMSQYFPEGSLEAYPELNRKLTEDEYLKVTKKALQLGFENIYIQDMSSSSKEFVPDFTEPFSLI